MRKGRIRKHVSTEHIMVQSNLCIDCGDCIKACPKEVLGRVNIIFHHHVHVERADQCIGCFKCVKACQQKAIVAISGKQKPAD